MFLMDLDDRQQVVHGSRTIAEALAIFRKELLAAGIRRVLTACLVMQQFGVMTRADPYQFVHLEHGGDDD